MSKKYRVALAQINPIVGDLEYNFQKIKDIYIKASLADVDLVVYPECVLTGYPAGDLFNDENFIAEQEKYIELIKTTFNGPRALFGAVRKFRDKFYNIGYYRNPKNDDSLVTKSILPNNNEFGEKRWFTNSKKLGTFIDECDSEDGDFSNVLALVCEDAWHPGEFRQILEDMDDGIHTGGNIDLVTIINASPYEIGKIKKREELARSMFDTIKAIQDRNVAIIYVNTVGGHDEMVFDGNSFIFDGHTFHYLSAFTEDFAIFDIKTDWNQGVTHVIRENGTNVPQASEIDNIYNALVLATHDYFSKNGFNKAVLGLSGGVDSALVAKIAADAIGAENVTGILMPSEFTTNESNTLALDLAANLGITTHTIPIKGQFDALKTAMAPLFGNRPVDVTEENMQAQIRGDILSAFSNKFGALILSTGNKSEIAVGYSTLYGDMRGGYNPLKDVYKTQVFALCHHINRNDIIIPERIITRPPSAELRAGQKDTDSLPDYDILDTILQGLLEHKHSPLLDTNKVLTAKISNMVARAEYKRFQSCPGPKISKKSFTYRDWQIPITNHWRMK